MRKTATILSGFALVGVIVAVVFAALALLSTPTAKATDNLTCDPDTGECWYDTDADGWPDTASFGYHADNCKTVYNPGQEDNDGDGIGNVCDSTPNGSGGGGGGGGGSQDLTANLSNGGYAIGSEYDVSSFYSIVRGAGKVTIRCKSQIVTSKWSELSLYDALGLETRFRVCYVPGTRIDSFLRSDPKLSPNPQVSLMFTHYPYQWDGVDSTFPQVAVYTNRVEMLIQGSVKKCILNYGCGTTRHPWVKIVFYANNTMVVTTGVI